MVEIFENLPLGRTLMIFAYCRYKMSLVSFSDCLDRLRLREELCLEETVGVAQNSWRRSISQE